MSSTLTSRAKITDSQFERTAAVLRVLGHPDRLRLMDVLLQRKVPVAELAERLGLAPNAVSQHLNIMLARGIVRRRRQGRRVYYEVADAISRNLLRCLWKAAGS